MKQEIVILANHNTKERIAVVIDPTENIITLEGFDEKFGGNWVRVGELSPGDMLKFTSDDIYLGFDNREDDNYCQGALIKKYPWEGFVKPIFIMKPTIGRVVIYNTTEADIAKMKAASIINGGCNIQDKLPAIIVAVHSDECVNLIVITGGNLDLRVTSANKGDQPMNWNWPIIER